MSLSFTWVGQGGYILNDSEGCSISIDPFFGTAKGVAKRNYDAPQNFSIRVDAVFSTHSHWDHFDPETYERYVMPKVIVGPGSCMLALKESGLKIPGFELNVGETYDCGNFKVCAVFADHTSDSVGYLVEHEGKKMYFAGDTLFTTKLIIANINLNPDVTFICINGKLGNMNFAEAAYYCRIIESKAAVPAHYDMMLHNTENPLEFTDAIARVAPEIRSTIVERGRNYDITEVL